MARSNVYGKCALCRKQRKLCKSHYLGRVLHTLSRDQRGDPVVMTPKFVTTTPKQLWAHLLCSSCEKLLNEKGEKPVQALFNGANGFPLLNRMELALPFKVSRTVMTYSGLSMGIDTEPLAYYALSMLWKGAVHKWTTLKGQKSFIKLGKHRERIRRYLLGEAGFPEGIYVIVTACTDIGSQGMNFAPAKMAGTRFPMYSLLIRGIWFHIAVTEEPVPVDNLCCYRSDRRVLHKADCSKEFLQAGRFIHKTATVSAKLRT